MELYSDRLLNSYHFWLSYFEKLISNSILSYLYGFRFVNFLVYFGLTYNTVSLAGSVYVNFFISGLSELPAILLGVFAFNW